MASEQRTISGEAAPEGGNEEAPATPDAEAPRAPAAAAPASPAATSPASPTQRMGVAPPYAPTPRIGIPTQAVPSPAPAEEPSERPSDPPEAGAPEKTSRERKNRFEALLPGIIRRGIERSIEAGLSTFEKSLETGRETTGAMREALNEVKAPRDVASAVGKAFSEAKLPRELASAVFSQIDDTKNDVLRILAREFREFLDNADLSGELKSALTSLSFEVRTEIRFIPNEAGEGVKADVRARSRVKRNPPPPRERRRRTPKTDDDEEVDGED